MTEGVAAGMRGPWFNLPNRITLGRLLASIVLFIALANMPETEPEARRLGLFALVLFVLVAASDWLDGYLARKYGQVTPLGRILDPFVDKVAVCGAYIMLLKAHPIADLIESWMVVVIVAREFFVNDSRGYFESKGISFGAEAPGKIKMVLQCVSVSFLLGQIAFENVFGILRVTNQVLLWVVLVATVASGIFYMRKGILLIRSAEA
jgi:CDP-diacylglycerol--glycerol-3-phosphate 3-phosphatidyltransferase